MGDREHSEPDENRLIRKRLDLVQADPQLRAKESDAPYGDQGEHRHHRDCLHLRGSTERAELCDQVSGTVKRAEEDHKIPERDAEISTARERDELKPSVACKTLELAKQHGHHEIASPEQEKTSIEHQDTGRGRLAREHEIDVLNLSGVKDRGQPQDEAPIG